MRVFPFKSLESASTGKPAEALSFLMEYPCVIGRHGKVGNKGKMGYEWLEIGPLSFIMRSERTRVSPIATPEDLDKTLSIVAALGGGGEMFVEPLKNT